MTDVTVVPKIERSAGRVIPTVAFDNIVENTTITGDLVVTPGENWLIGENVEVDGNVLVEGTDTVLSMRPGSSLKFLNADPANYTGGGLNWDEGPFPEDIGLWVWAGAKLDIQGTEKVSWTRDPASEETWDLTNDEMWIAPTAVGDRDPRRWFENDPIPRVPIPSDVAIPNFVPQDWIDNGIPAEVANVTRDIVIEGPGHVHINSTVPQTLEYFALRNMGIIRPNEGSAGAGIGRYVLHLHMAQEGLRGTVGRGIAAIGSRGRVYVAHSSHGCSFIDCVTVNSWADGMWWDIGDDTNDFLCDRMLVMGVKVDREVIGETPRFDAMTLGSGLNMEIRNSVVCGLDHNKPSAAYDWVSGGQAPNPVWVFDTFNIAHNNKSRGLRFWTNLEHHHTVHQYIGYRNDEGGIENGAYRNRVSYFDSILFEDFFFQQSNTDSDEGEDLPRLTVEDVTIHRPGDIALQVGHRNLPAKDFAQYIGMDLTGDPKVRINQVKSNGNPWLADFRDCDVHPDDFVWEDPTHENEQGSHVRIFEGGTHLWDIEIIDGAKVVTEVALAEVQVPTQGDFTSQGAVLTPSAGEWDARFPHGTPGPVLKVGSKWLMYYIGADGDRSSDGGPAHRAVGVATADTLDGPWTKDPSNPVIPWSTLQNNNDEEEGAWRLAGFVASDGTVVLLVTDLVGSGGGVNGDVRLFTSADGIDFTDQGIVMDHSDATFPGNDELGALGAWEADDGTVYIFYAAKGGVSPGDWNLSLASGPARDNITAGEQLVGPTPTGSDQWGHGTDPIPKSEDDLLVFMGENGGDFYAYAPPRSDPSAIGSPVQTYSGLVDDQFTIVLDRDNSMWHLFGSQGPQGDATEIEHFTAPMELAA